MPTGTLPIEAIEAFINEQIRLGQMPGLGISIHHDGAVWERGYGVSDVLSGTPMTERTGVVIGSTTKALTCVAIQQLADRGLLSLDDLVTKFIPTFRLANSTEPPAITIRQAITHSAGLPPTRSDDPSFLFNDDAADDALARYVDTLPSLQPIWEPGAGWAYANDGYVLAGRIIELLSGLSYEDYMRRYVLTPLQLKETGFSPDELSGADVATAHDYDADGAPYPSFFPHNRASAAGGSQLIMSARDAGSWLQVALDGGKGPGGPLLSAERFAESLRPQFPIPSGTRGSDGADTFYALGWMVGAINGIPAIQHGGSTITMGSQFVLVPEHRLAIAVVANSSTLTTSVIAAGVLSLILGRQPSSSFPQVDPKYRPDQSQWPLLVGTYLPQATQNSVPGPLPIVYEDGTLRALTYKGDERRRPGDIHMRPTGDLQFVLSGRGRTGSRATFTVNGTSVQAIWTDVPMIKQP